MVPAMKLYMRAGWEFWRKGYHAQEVCDQLAAAGDPELFEAASRLAPPGFFWPCGCSSLTHVGILASLVHSHDFKTHSHESTRVFRRALLTSIGVHCHTAWARLTGLPKAHHHKPRPVDVGAARQ